MTVLFVLLRYTVTVTSTAPSRLGYSALKPNVGDPSLALALLLPCCVYNVAVLNAVPFAPEDFNRPWNLGGPEPQCSEWSRSNSQPASSKLCAANVELVPLSLRFKDAREDPGPRSGLQPLTELLEPPMFPNPVRLTRTEKIPVSVQQRESSSRLCASCLLMVPEPSGGCLRQR